MNYVREEDKILSINKEFDALVNRMMKIYNDIPLSEREDISFERRVQREIEDAEETGLYENMTAREKFLSATHSLMVTLTLYAGEQ